MDEEPQSCTPRLPDLNQHQQAEQWLAVQYAVSQVLLSAATVEDATARFVQAIGAGLGWEWGAFWCVDEAAQVLRCAATWQAPARKVAVFEAASRPMTFAPGVGLPGRVWASGTPVWVADVLTDDNFPRRTSAAQAGLHAVVAFPVQGSHGIHGVIECFSVAIQPLDEDLLRVVAVLGTQLGQFIERAQADAALREREARHAAIVAAALDCIITMDQQGRVVEFNPAAEQTFGYRRADVIGQEMAALIIPPPLRARHRRGLAHYLATGEATVLGRRLELMATRADGSQFPVELTITRLSASDPPLFTGFVRDLTAHKQAEAEREHLLASEQRARREAEAAVRLRDEFLATVSHDLQNPLGIILGQAQLLQRRLAGSEMLAVDRVRTGLTQIEAATRRATRLIRELLDVARLQAGQPLELERQPTDLVALVRQVTAQHQPAAGHGIQVEAKQPALVGSWDAGRLERVLANVLDNAVKYSPAGGAIRVRVDREGGVAVLTVQDQGIGIPAADLPHVFERFHRAGNVSGRTPGTGLGLASARQIVEQHGGTIMVESQEGAGSTVTIRLPLGEACQRPEPAG